MLRRRNTSPRLLSRAAFRFLFMWAAIVMPLVGPTTRAVIKEPDNLLWGNVVVAGKVVTAAETNIVVEARRTLADAPLASYRMGDNPAAANLYSLAMPLESVSPINDPNATRTGEQILILVHNGEFVRYLTLYTLGERGRILRLDLGDVDADGNGLIDNWERQYFGAAGQAPNGDPDRDGVGNRDEMLGGTNPLVPDARHPADVNPTNNVITIHEVTAYALAWKTGQPWPVAPTNIPVDFVARAGFLWKNGEKYIMDTNALALGAPLWWTNSPPAATSNSLAGFLSDSTPKPSRKSTPLPARASTIVRGMETPREGVWAVRLSVAPAEHVSAYVVEEKVPMGRAVSDIDSEGFFDSATGSIRWGPFYDHGSRELKYRVGPAGASSAGGQVTGVGSFDGMNATTVGDSRLGPLKDLRWDPPQLSAEDRLKLKLRGEAGRRYAIEVSNDLMNWSSATALTASDDGWLEFGESVAHLAGPRFYRARPLTE